MVSLPAHITTLSHLLATTYRPYIRPGFLSACLVGSERGKGGKGVAEQWPDLSPYKARNYEYGGSAISTQNKESYLVILFQLLGYFYFLITGISILKFENMKGRNISWWIITFLHRFVRLYYLNYRLYPHISYLLVV